jgi:hypothetical protein
VSLYKRQKATRMVQVLKSSDPGVRKAANLQLEEERKKQRVKSRPAVPAANIRAENPRRVNGP